VDGHGRGNAACRGGCLIGRQGRSRAFDAGHDEDGQARLDVLRQALEGKSAA
jgi:hypothetical protein